MLAAMALLAAQAVCAAEMEVELVGMVGMP